MVLQHFDIEQGKLAVDVEGEGPLVICAPALGDLRNAYAPLAKQLVANGYTVAVIDVRGHGDSSTEFKKYGDEAAADDFLEIIRHLNKGPAVLVGASFSAGGATIAAGRQPNLVRGVVLLGPFLRNGMGGGAAATYLANAIVMRPWGPTLWKSYSKSLWPGLGPDKAEERATECINSLTRPGRWSAFQATVKGADHRVVAPWLEKARAAPALVVMGEKDPDWGKPLEEAEWVASNFDDSQIVPVADAGHAPHLERPEVVGKAVVEFLARLK